MGEGRDEVREVQDRGHGDVGDGGRNEGPAPGLWAPQRRALTVGLVLTVTLVGFEALAVATVMPDVSEDLGGIGLYGWVFSGFFLGNLLGTAQLREVVVHYGDTHSFSFRPHPTASGQRERCGPGS